MFDAILEALKIHGPIGAVFLAFGAMGHRHIASDDSRQKAILDRLSALETDRVTKHDLERVFDRIEGMSEQMAENQNTLLTALSQRGR